LTNFLNGNFQAYGYLTKKVRTINALIITYNFYSTLLSYLISYDRYCQLQLTKKLLSDRCSLKGLALISRINLRGFSLEGNSFGILDTQCITQNWIILFSLYNMNFLWRTWHKYMHTHMHTHTCTHARTHTHTTALWILSGTTQVSRYQKKHSPTHTYCGHIVPCLLHPS